MTRHPSRDTARNVFYQPDPTNPDGYLLPYHLNSLTTGAQAIPSTSHAWLVQHTAWTVENGQLGAGAPGRRRRERPVHHGLLRARADIPFQRALAEAFTIWTTTTASVLGPTHPNRYMWMTGTIDPNGENGGPALDNGTTNGTYTWTTYAENLTRPG